MSSSRQAKINKILNWDLKVETLNAIRSLTSPRQRAMPETYTTDCRLEQLNNINIILGKAWQRVPDRYKNKTWEICLDKIAMHEKYDIGDVYSNLFEVLKDAKDGIFIDTNNDKNLCLQ